MDEGLAATRLVPVPWKHRRANSIDLSNQRPAAAGLPFSGGGRPMIGENQNKIRI
jgi:hypothetical protein